MGGERREARDKGKCKVQLSSFPSLAERVRLTHFVDRGQIKMSLSTLFFRSQSSLVLSSMSNGLVARSSLSRNQTIVLVAVAVLGLKVLLGILYEYRWYFPANFVESAFLTGREETFTRFYALAFYTHILSGPPTIVLGTFLVWSRGVGPYRRWHRWAGRLQIALVLLTLVPSGLVMATRAFAGPIAGWGFAALSIATAVSAAFTVWYACLGRISRHERWATRLYILLISPLILRIISGVLIVTGSESEIAYRLNAWLSWLIPLATYEIWQYQRGMFQPVFANDAAAERNVKLRDNP